jgi:sulfur-oxidizing protein SoxY
MRTVQSLSRRKAILAGLGAGVSARAGRALADDDAWPALSGQIFADRSIADGGAALAIDAPYRAEDAAVVPIGLRLLRPSGERVRGITLVVDQNPSPLAARFVLGENSGIRTISTRIRVDSYTNIHAVAETSDGSLLAAERFVKAAGGCSAPAAKQTADAIPLGSMRLRQFAPGTDPDRREVALMIRHPNYSGMQMDQITRLYVPAHFVSSITIWQGDDLLLGVESGISISENPEFRFDYRPNGAASFRAEVEDNKGGQFKQAWSVMRV